MLNIILVCLGTFFSRLGQSVVLPYMLLIMHVQKGVPTYIVGIVMGLSFFCNAIGALFLKYFHNKNSFSILQFSIVIYMLSFVIFYFVTKDIQTLWIFIVWFLILNALMGFCRSFIESLGQMILSATATKGNNTFKFNLRYFMLNVGAFAGPLIAVWLHILNNILTFLFMSVVLCMYWLMLLIMRPKEILINIASTKLGASLKTGWDNLKFRYFIITSMILFMGFSQMNFLFAYASYHVTHTTTTFVIMAVINTGLIICLQLPLTKLLDLIDIHVSIILGILGFIVGFLILGVAQNAWQFYCGTVFFTFGEILAISLVGIYIDLGFKQNKDVFYSLSELVYIGQIVGVVFSSIMLNFMHAQFVLMLYAVILSSAIYTIIKAKNIKTIDSVTV